VLRRSEEKKKIVTCRRSCRPPPHLSIYLLSFSYFVVVQITSSTRWTLFHHLLQEKKNQKKKQFLFNPSLKEMLRDTQAVANFILTVIYINVSHLYILSFQFGFSHLSKSTACSYRMHLILPIVPLSQLSN